MKTAGFSEAADLQRAYLLPLHDDRLRQRVVAPLLVGEPFQVIQLRLQLKNEIFLLLPLSLQTFPLLPFSLQESHKRQLQEPEDTSPQVSAEASDSRTSSKLRADIQTRPIRSIKDILKGSGVLSNLVQNCGD